MPGPLRTRLIFGIIGIFYFCKKPLPSYCIKILFCWALCLCVATISSIYNNYFDYWFFQFIIIDSIYLIGAFFIVDLYKSKLNLDINRLLLIIVTCILVHNLISFSGFLFSPIQTVLKAIQKLSNMDLINGMMMGKTRAFGLGDGNVFHGGVISGIGLIITLYLGKINYIPSTKCIVYSIIILLTGIFIARTTLIGLVGLLFLFTGTSKQRKHFLKICLKLLLVSIVCITILITFLSEYVKLGWAFEMIFSYMDKGTLESASTNQLSDMYVFPNNLKTWIIGDARMVNPDGSYYMSTDVGYNRLIFFWGIAGCITYFIVIMSIWGIIYFKTHSNNIHSLIILLFIYLLILNLKGLVDISFIIYLIAPVISYKPKFINQKYRYKSCIIDL